MIQRGSALRRGSATSKRAPSTGPAALARTPRVVDRVGDERREVEMLPDLLADLVQPCERQQVLDAHTHPCGLLLDPAMAAVAFMGTSSAPSLGAC